MELHPILEKGEWLAKQNMWYVVSAKGQHPSMRVGQCCCHLRGSDTNSLGKLAVIGGANPSGPFDETHLLDFDEYEWDEPEMTGFLGRYEHASFIPSSRPDQITIFGGAERDKNLNCVQTLDLVAKTWSTVPTSGTPPSPRTCRGSVAEGNKLYVFAGGLQGPDPVGDTQIHVYDADTIEWSQLPSAGKVPPARHGHVMALCEGKIYVHGGMAGSTIYSDMHEYSLDTGTWKLIKCKGDIPSGRAAHGCVFHGNKILIFGGMTQEGASDECFVFDTRKSRWTKFSPSGPPPAPRLDHAMCLVTLPCPRETPQLSSSRSSQNGAAQSQAPSGAVPAGDPERSAETFLSSCVEAVAEQMGSAPETSGEGAVGGAGAATVMDSDATLCCLVQGGMDTHGEIFDDTLLLRLDNIF
ncbi:rab9 effector protein with kelch motifs-like [Diadema setosum]|uniref:rab9 effector protein with kelch motifs-like n=1 Tax=Diadema setosum TaxID=31175 RepID=UPI003B3B75A4